MIGIFKIAKTFPRNVTDFTPARNCLCFCTDVRSSAGPVVLSLRVNRQHFLPKDSAM